MGAVPSPTPHDLEGLRAGLELMAVRALGDREAAEEAAQETLSRAVAVLRAGRPIEQGNLAAFVRGIARHVIVDAQRARRRTAPLEVAPPADLTSRSNPLALLVTREERARVRDALTQLSPDDRDLLQLAYFEGLTPADIARRSGEPAARIRKRKSRALARLREAFLGEPARSRNASRTDLVVDNR